jgi:hypothetical protein
MVRVLDLCGDPSTVTERVVHRTQQVQRYVSPGVIVTDVVTVSVTLTEWIYDFGPTRFMRGLVFEDGRLRVIDTLGYGTASGRTASIDDGERSVRSAWSELSETRSSGGLGGGAGGAPHREAPKATQAIDARARPLVALPARRYAPSA